MAIRQYIRCMIGMIEVVNNRLNMAMLKIEMGRRADEQISNFKNYPNQFFPKSNPRIWPECEDLTRISVTCAVEWSDFMRVVSVQVAS